MKRLWIGLFVVCLVASAAQAGTVKYEFTATVTDQTGLHATNDKTVVIALEIGTLPSDIDTGNKDEGEYMASAPGDSSFLTWSLTVGTDTTATYSTLGKSDWISDAAMVLDGDGGSDTVKDLDEVQFTSFYDFTDLFWIQMTFTSDSDAEAIKGSEQTPSVPDDDLPILNYDDWDTIEIEFSDRKAARRDGVTGSGVSFDATITKVTLVPLPSAAWVGLGLLGALGVIRRIRRRK